jgi:hypothetical protein
MFQNIYEIKLLNIKSHIGFSKIKVLIEIKPPGRALVWLPGKKQ